MSEFESWKFKQLKAQWYDLVRATGFEDIENDKGQLDAPTLHNLSLRVGFKQGIVGGIQDYYSWAIKMHNEANFKSPTDKLIWKMHAQGKSTREIGETVKLEHSWVARKIKSIRSYVGRGL